MKEFFNLIPPGWTFNIYYDPDKRLFEIHAYDNVGAGNKVCVTPEFINSAYNPEIAIKEMIKEINKLYGL